MTSSVNLSSFCQVDYTRFCLKALGLYTMFSINYSSARKGPFKASKAKNVRQRQQFKMFDSNNFTLSSKPTTHKMKSCVHVYLSTFPYLFIHFPFEKRIGSQLSFFKIHFFFILVNLQEVAGGKKCCFRR